MKNRRIVNVLSYLMVLAASLGGTALAQSIQRNDSVASLSTDRTEVRWQPNVEYGRLILTVSRPDGEVFRKEFGAGAIASFKLADTNGYNLPDGQYAYELRVIPNFSAEVKAALAASREKGNSAEVIQELQRSGQLPTSVAVQSGAFRLENGTALIGAPEEGSEPQDRAVTGAGAKIKSRKGGAGPVTIQDQVIPDDLIVQFSLCVGIDCVNNESFGFDTIKLKENNLRIKFEDTSVGSFPSNDWQLTANDSASGGANRFSIEDITGGKVPFTVTAGAPTNSVFVSSAGRLGLGTSTPGTDIHKVSGNTPTLRLDQDGSSGFTSQVWDVAGNETNFFIRDVTNASHLPFRIVPGAPTNSLVTAASGNVGLGTLNPLVRLHVGTGNVAPVTGGASLLVENGTASSLVVKSTSGGEFFLYQDANNGVFGTSSNHPIDIRTNNAGRIFITETGNIGVGGLTTPTNPIQHLNGAFLSPGGVWTDASSRALKTDIRNLGLGEALEALRGLNPVKFQYKQQPGEDYVGFIAEDVPAVVATADRKGLSPMDVVGVLTKIVQEQQKAIAELNEKVNRLSSRRATSVRRRRRP